jgi:CobQ/CobB/MinD/ParA nucleotide binding domain
MSDPTQLPLASLDFGGGPAYVQDGSSDPNRETVSAAAVDLRGAVTTSDALPGEDAGRPGLGSGGSALDALTRPVAILVGHFGSGKTEIAINLAFGLRNRGAEVTLVDLDLGKPYFRCRLAKDDLEARGVRLAAPTGDCLQADLPILVPGARTAARGENGLRSRLIFDVGGDDLGARVLGSFSGLLDRRTTELLFVVNANRPFAEDLPSLRQMLSDVQAAARLGVTGLVANTHLMDETTPDTVREGIRAARELEAATGIPLRFSAMQRRLAEAFGGAGGSVDQVPILAMERHIVAPFAARPWGSRRRSSVV